MYELSIENVYHRHTAKLLARKHFWKLLGMIAINLGIVVALVCLQELTDSLLWFVVALVEMLLACGLGLGLNTALLQLCRGDESVSVGQVFGCMNRSLKALGLNLWVGFKLLLWTLPILPIMYFVVGGILVISDPVAMEATAAAETATLVAVLLVFFAVEFGLVLPAALRYSLSNYILADHPELGVFACVQRSKALMKGHKWQAFKLTLPLQLIAWAVTQGVLFVATLIGPSKLVMALALLVILVTVLLVTIRADLCWCLFYLKREEEHLPVWTPPAPLELPKTE